MTTYRSRAAEAVDKATDPGNYLPCRVCKGSTPRAMLSQYGAQCRECFDDYCRQGPCGDAPPLRTYAERKAAAARMVATLAAKAIDRRHGAAAPSPARLPDPPLPSRVPLPGTTPPDFDLPPVEAYGAADDSESDE